ncbi:MAG: alpha/beta hydrolase [Armatimonadetes bacterium]|nr:alpha/beta hydrolase [Armatimonadota bacterium]NOG38101.1 alpha/beta hydrolase [Armatimonadota bacterium]
MWSCSLVLTFLMGGIDRDVVYSQPGGERLQMDIYHPQTLSSEPKPAVLVIHGGAWVSGKRQDMATMCEALAKEGFLAATVSYRLAPKHKWPTMVEDVRTAVRYLRSRAAELKIDPNRLGAAGASAGGHLALLLGASDSPTRDLAEYKGFSSQVQAVFNLFGPTDLGNDYPQSLDLMFAVVLGKPKNEATEIVKNASPVTHIGKKSAPVFTLHGKADPLVPVKQAERLDAALKAKGVEHQMRLIDGMKHEVDMTNPAVSSALTEALNWLKKKLSPESGAAQLQSVSART